VGPGGGSWSHDACARSQSWPVPGVGAGAIGHVAAPELSRALVVGAEAMRHVGAPGLPYAKRWELRGTRACAPVLSFIFDLELVRGGIRSLGYQQWSQGPS
jgi:hypothetical protein